MSLFTGLTQWQAQQYVNFANEAEQEINDLALQWGVHPQKAYELVDLYKAHTPYVWQVCVNRLSHFDYQQTQELVNIACIGE